MIKWSISKLNIIKSFQMNYFNQAELNFKRIRSEGFCLANVFVIMKTFLVLKR